MRNDPKGVIALVFAGGLFIALLAGVGGIIWRGDKITTQGSVVIGMLVGAIVIISAAYLGIFLTLMLEEKMRRKWELEERWPIESAQPQREETLTKAPR